MNTQLSSLLECAVHIPCAEGELRGDLTIPAGATGLVIFAHGSGSSRLSPRNRMVAEEMHEHHLATLLVDLLTLWESIAEERTGELRFNIPFLTSRLAATIRWAGRNEDIKRFGIGLFGSSTGAAAALCAAARMPEVRAVVSRGGRTDLAQAALGNVRVPTLMIVGENDETVMAWNEQAYERLPGIKRLIRIPGATHLFREEGALEEVASSASTWFEQYLSSSGP